MKVAILTLHNTPNNCGAVLQAYALQRVLEKMGHEAAIIDYYRERGDLKPWWSFSSVGGIYHTGSFGRSIRCFHSGRIGSV